MYFNIEEVRDELLRDALTEEDIQESTQYVHGLAARLNVPQRAIRLPVAYPIQQLALFYALMVCARNKSMFVEGDDLRTNDDAYERKRRIYLSEYQRWESRITADTFTGLDGVDTGEGIPLTSRVRRM